MVAIEAAAAMSEPRTLHMILTLSIMSPESSDAELLPLLLGEGDGDVVGEEEGRILFQVSIALDVTDI